MLRSCSGGPGQDRQAGQVWSATPGATLLGPHVQQVHWPPWPSQAALGAGVCGCLNCVWTLMPGARAQLFPHPHPSRPKSGATIRAALGILCIVEDRAGRGGTRGSERGSDLPQVTQPVKKQIMAWASCPSTTHLLAPLSAPPVSTCHPYRHSCCVSFTPGQPLRILLGLLSGEN